VFLSGPKTTRVIKKFCCNNLVMELEEVARKYALKNAVEYSGECNPSAVIGSVINETGEEPGTVGKVAGKICGQVNQLSLEEQEEK